MVRLEYKYGLPFCEITIEYEGKLMTLDNILIDTGSGGTIFKMDMVDNIGITIEKEDTIETISGVGGVEFVYKKNIDKIIFGNSEIDNFNIEIGVMDYGFDINGIIGIDFMKHIGAIIDLDKMVVYIRDMHN
ncbi:retropepsin-like aspartic protease [Senegalia sp. (in: firmicutes)]|uniref:retropepsin-like aspartic protease n=1 Tax=Senegalia sp. (in: firmicutes) TaxID=1924098 RepID=UPI003F9A54A4